MAIAEVFPYSDQHNLNLDWIIMKIKEFSGNQISAIACEQLDADTVKFVITYTDGSTTDLTEITLPQGPQGVQGETGATGATPELSIGTVSTLPAGSDASVTITGTAEAPVINMGIPQGVQGETGAAGGIANIDGYTGAVTTGAGIAFDTSTGALSSYDFNLVNTASIPNTIADSNFTNIDSHIAYALNSDKSIGKVYGYFWFTQGALANDTYCRLDLGFKVAVPDNAYNINCGGIAIQSNGLAPNNNGLYVDATGEVYYGQYLGAAQNGKRYLCTLPAAIYFFKDFGDTPDNRSLGVRMAAISPDPIEARER